MTNELKRYNWKRHTPNNATEKVLLHGIVWTFNRPYGDYARDNGRTDGGKEKFGPKPVWLCFQQQRQRTNGTEQTNTFSGCGSHQEEGDWVNIEAHHKLNPPHCLTGRYEQNGTNVWMQRPTTVNSGEIDCFHGLLQLDFESYQSQQTMRWLRTKSNLIGPCTQRIYREQC